MGLKVVKDSLRVFERQLAALKKAQERGWFFEYIYEPVFQDEPSLLYKKNLHRLVAMVPISG